MSADRVRYEDLIGLWQEGPAKAFQAEPTERAAIEAVIDELVVQLRRRLGGPFHGPASWPTSTSIREPTGALTWRSAWPRASRRPGI